MPDLFRIIRASPSLQLLAGLTDLLIDTVEGGASVGFMLPLTRERAQTFWERILADVQTGGRVLLVAEEVSTGAIVGTVQLVTAMPDNQPHRADVAKMQVLRRVRGQGLGTQLMQQIELVAIEEGKTLLVLDTVTGSDAERLYTRLDWVRCGEIPNYALFPQGGYCSTTIFYKDLSKPETNRG